MINNGTMIQLGTQSYEQRKNKSIYQKVEIWCSGIDNVERGLFFGSWFTINSEPMEKPEKTHLKWNNRYGFFLKNNKKKFKL